MTASIRCLCSRCRGQVIYPKLSDYLDAHEADPGIDEDDRDGSRSRHPSVPRMTFEDGSQLEGDLVRSSSGDEWRQLRLPGL